MEDCKTNEILTLQKSLAEKDGVIKQLYALIAKKDESLEKKKKIITKYSQLCMSKATNVRQVSEFVSRYDFQLFDLLVPDLLSKIDALKKKCEDQNSSNEHLKYLEREIERKENIRLRDELLIKQYAQMIEDSKVIQEELRNKQHKQKMVCLQLENKCKDFLKWTRRLGKIIEKHDVPLKKADRNLLCKIQQQSKTKASDVLQSCTFEEEDATNDVESKIFKNQETQTDCLIPNSPIPKHHRKIATYTDGLGILSPSLTSDSGVSLSPVLSLSGLSPLSLNESCTRFKDSIQTYGPYDQEPVPPNLDPKKDIGPTGECHLDMNPASPSTSVFDPELMNNDPLPRDTDLDDGISNEILDDMLNDASEKFNTSVMDELNLSTDNVESSIGVSTDDVVEDNCKVESNESPKHSDIISQEIIYEDNKYVEVIRYQDHFEVLIHSEELDGQNKQCNDGTTYIETDTPSKIKYNVNKLSEEIGEETSKTRNLSTEEPGKSTLLSGKIENVVQILEKSDNTEQAVDEEQSTTSSAIERKSIVENEIAKVDDTEVCEKLKSDDKQIGSITTQISAESNVSSVISNKICFELESLQNHTDISSNYDHSHSAAQDIENDRHLEKMTPFTKEEILDMEIIIADESGKEIEEFESLSAIPDPLSEPTVDSVIKEKLEPEATQLECPRQDMPTTSSVSLNAVKSVEDSDVSTKNSHDDLVNESENIKSISENISESKSKSTDEINYCLVNNMDEISPKTSHDYLVNVSDIKSISENIPEQKSKLIDENISCLVANKEESTSKTSHDNLVNESENIISSSEKMPQSKSDFTDENNSCLVDNMDGSSPKILHDNLEIGSENIKSSLENIPKSKSKLIDENISCLVANKEESTSKISHDNLVNESENIISSSEKMPQSKSDFTDENNSWLDLLKESENIKSILENKPELKSKVIDENISCLVANKEESTPKTSHDNLMNESENISEKTPQSELKLTDKNISRIASKKDENTPKTSFSVERQKTAPPKSIFDLIDDSDRDNNNYSPVTVLSPSKCLAFDDDSNSSDVLQQSTHSGSYQNCHPIQFKTPELPKQLSEPDKNSNVNRKIEDKVLDKIMRKMQMKSIFKGPAISPIPPSPKTSREGPSLQKELSMLSSDEEKNSSATIQHLCVENSTKSMRNAGKPSHTKKHHDLGDERGVPHPSKGETLVQPRTIAAENLLHSAVSNPIPEFNFKKPKSVASPNKLVSIRSSKETKRLERVTETSPKCSKQDQSHNNKSLLSPDKLASVPSSKETKLLERAIETSPTCSKPNQSNNKKSSSLGMTTSSNENISTPKHLLGKKIKDLGKRKQVDYLQVSGEKVNSVDGSFKSSTVKLGLESQTLKPFNNLSEPSCLENFKHNDNSIAVEDVNVKLTPELSEGDNSTSFCDSGFIECDVEKLLDDIRGEFYVPDCIDKLTDLINSSDTMEMNSEQVDVFKETLVAVETSTQVKSCTMDQSPGHIERSEVYPTSSQTKDKIQQIFVPPSSVIDDSEAEVLKKLKDSTLLDDNLIKNSESETSCMINNTSIDESPRRPSPFQGLEENIESLPVSIDYIQEQDEFVIENMKSEISCMINNTRINESPRSPSPLQGLKENIESLPVAIDNLQKQGESDLIGSHLNVIENLKSETSMVNNKSIDESPRSPSPFEKKESETSCMINNTRIDGERITLESIDESPRSPSPFQALVENIESLPVSIDNPQKQDEPDLRGSLLNEQQRNSKQHFPADDTQQCVLNSYVIDNETSQASIKLSDNSGFDVFASNEQVDRIDPSQSIDKIAKSTSESILVRGFGRSRSNSAELHIEIPPVYAYLSDSGVSDFEGWACTSKSKENNIKIPTVSKNLPGDSDFRSLVRASKSPEKRITDPVLSKNLSDSGRSEVRNDQKMEGIQSNDGGGSRKKIKKRNVKTRETVSTPLRRSARLTQISPLGTSCGGDSKQNHSSSSKQKNSEKRIALNELPQSSIVVDKLSPAEILFNKISPTNFSENKYDTQPFMNTRSRSLPARLSHIPQLLNPKKRCLCINCDDYDSKDAPPLKKDKRERVRCVNIDSKKTSALKRSNSVHKINSSPRQMIDSKVSSRRNAGRNMKNENVCERQSRKRISYPFYNSVRRSSRLSLEKMKTSDDQNHRIESVKSDEQNKPSCEEMNGNKEPESSSITSNCISKNSSSLEANRSSPVDSESPPPLFDKNFKDQSSPLNSKFINDAPSNKHSEAFPSPINSTMMVENIVVDDDDDDGDLLIDCEEDSKEGNQVHSSTNDEIRSSNCAEMESGVTSMQSDQSSGFTTTACQSLVQRHISVCAIEQSPILRRSPRKSTIIASQCSESRFNLRIDSTPNLIDRSAEVQKQNIEQNCRSADFNDPLRIDSSVPNESTNSQTPNTESIPAFNFYTEVSEASKQADKRKSDPIDIDAKRRKLNDEEESQQYTIPLNTNEVEENVDGLNRLEEEKIRMVPCDNVILLAYHYHRRNLSNCGGIGDSSPDESQLKVFEDQAEEVFIRVAKARLEAKEEEHVEKKKDGEEEEEYWTCEVLEACLEKLKGIPNDVISDMLVDTLYHDQGYLDSSAAAPVSDLQNKIITIAYKLCSDRPEFFNSLLSSFRVILLENTAETVECYCRYVRCLTLLCRALHKVEEMRWFVYDALYFRIKSGFAMAHTALTMWPSILPMASPIERTSPLALCISHVLSKHSRNLENIKITFYKADKVDALLRTYYGYEEIDKNTVFEHLMKCLHTNVDGALEALVLLCKRIGPKWTFGHVCESLMRILNQWKLKKNNGEAVIRAIRVLSYILRPFMQGTHIIKMNEFLRTIGTFLTDSEADDRIQAVAAESLCRLSRVNMPLCTELLIKWKPRSGKVPLDLIKQMRAFIARKKPVVWLREMQKNNVFNSQGHKSS